MKQNKTDDPESEYVHKLIEDFEHEEEIKKYYTKEAPKLSKIMFDQFEEFDGKTEGMHLFIDQKEITTVLDLKREVVMTMLNSLEKLPEDKGKFFRFEGVLPANIGVRFHKTKPSETTDPFLQTFVSLAKEH